jgi:hypothetical protein
VVKKPLRPEVMMQALFRGPPNGNLLLQFRQILGLASPAKNGSGIVPTADSARQELPWRWLGGCVTLAVLAACVQLEPPGDGANPDQVRSYCRAATNTARLQELDRPGAAGPVAQQAPATASRQSDAEYRDCLRRYGVTG